MHSLIKHLLVLLAALAPAGRARTIYTNVFRRTNDSGPKRFLHNLESVTAAGGCRLQSRRLAGSSAALLIVCAPGDYFYPLCRWRGVRVVLRVDGCYPPALFDGRAGRVLDHSRRALNRRMAKDLANADWVVYQSVFSKQMLDQHLYRRDADFSIIHNGVDTAHFRPRDRQDRGHKILLLGSWRDAPVVLAGLGLLRGLCSGDTGGFADRPPMLKIIGPMTAAVDAAVARWLGANPSLAGRVELCGAVDFERLPAALAECRCAVHLKFADWCPNAVLEAMACGVPVIAMRYGGTAELVADAGILIDAEPFVYDAVWQSKIVGAIARIGADWERYSTLARARARCFDNAIAMAQYAQLLGLDSRENWGGLDAEHLDCR